VSIIEDEDPDYLEKSYDENPDYLEKSYVSSVLRYALLSCTMQGPSYSTPSPNVVVEWLTLLLRIWEVSGSNLRPETDYID
jgi:hypothetical protein